LADQLCTLAQVKARIGDSDVTDDTLIGEIIDEVSAWVQGYTGRKFVPVNSADYYFDTQAGYVLRVPIGIRTITFLGVNNTTHQPDTGGTYTTVAASDYLLRPRVQDLPDGWPFQEVHISRGVLAGTISSFGRIDNGCKITMAAGFAAIPKDIEAVAIDAAVVAYQSRMNGASSVIGADDLAIPPWRNYFGRGSPQMQTLGRYRYYGMA
jgi:hypothetical protein